MSTKKKIVVLSKEELQDLLIHTAATEMQVPERYITGHTRLDEAEALAKLKEINRRKANRLEARKNLAAKRMGYDSWSNFGKQFTEALIHLEATGATQAQVNATIKVILLRSAKAILPGEKEVDTKLREILEANPRLRENWRKTP